jgi:hypothetical protein
MKHAELSLQLELIRGEFDSLTPAPSMWLFTCLHLVATHLTNDPKPDLIA